MAAKVARQSHSVRGPLAIAGVLTEEHVKGEYNSILGRREWPQDTPAEVMCSDTATIQSGAWVVRTSAGTESHGREKTDNFVYVPYRSARSLNHCILEIKQILLVRRKGMEWRGDEARLAVGTLWDHLVVRDGAGLETAYNDDPASGACSVPRAVYLSEKRKSMGYPYALFLRQVHCPCVVVPGPPGMTFITLSKMGYPGRRDLLHSGTDVAESDSDNEEFI